MASLVDVMYRHINDRSIGRARWFADVQTALAEAESMLDRLEDYVQSMETIRLAQSIRVLRDELDGMNRVVLTDERVVGEAWPLIELTAGS